MFKLKTVLDRNSFVPLYKQIEQILRSEILQNESIEPNILIPSEQKLADVLKVQRLTVRKAIKKLVEEGLLYKIGKSGTFVRKTQNIVNNVIDIVFPKHAIQKMSGSVNWFVLFDVFRGINAKADMYNYYVHTIDISGKGEVEKTFFKKFKQKKSVGIIFLGHFNYGIVFEKLKQMKFPYIVAPSLKKDLHINTVYTDIENDIFNAVKYLIESGHKKIALINDSLTNPYAQERYNGYVKALNMKYIPIDDSIISECVGDIESGYNAMKKILSNNKKITAVFASTDLRAIGAMKAIKENGFKIPQDISVMGYDDIEDASLQKPSLTTVRSPRYEMGVKAVELLHNMINGEIISPVQELVSGKLIIRASVTKK